MGIDELDELNKLNEKLVKDLTVKELKELIREVVCEELMFSNRKVSEYRGFSLEKIKFPKRCEITWGE